MNNELNKIVITIRTKLSKLMAYRMDFFLTLIAPSFMFLFVKYSLWTSIYANSGKEILSGYTLDQMINYQLWTTLVFFLIRSHNSFDLSVDIRHGKISTYLIYPISFFRFHFAGFFAMAAVQTVVALISLGVFKAFGVIEIPAISRVIGVFAFCYMVSIFWFLAQFLIGLLTFWLDETWVLRVIFGIIGGFLNGSVLPIEFYPTYMQKVIIYTPFYYLSHYPVKMFMGQLEFSMLSVYVFIFWSLVLGILINMTWKRGIKEYTAAGI